MKMSKRRYLFILPIIALTSCGYSLEYLVKGDKYVSAVFKENYYTHWDNELKNPSSEIVKAVDDDHQMRIISECTPHLPFDLVGLDQFDDQYFGHIPTDEQFASTHRLINYDDSFNYGVQSKLFDGQVKCHGNLHRARVQTNKQGFSVRFSKESDELKYLAAQFRVTTDNTVACYNMDDDVSTSEPRRQADEALFHNSTLSLKLSVFTKEGNAIVKHAYTVDIVYNNKETNDGNYYTFQLISFEGENLSRAVGLSVEYEVNDELINKNAAEGIDIDYAVMMYEMYLPYTTWH